MILNRKSFLMSPRSISIGFLCFAIVKHVFYLYFMHYRSATVLQVVSSLCSARCSLGHVQHCSVSPRGLKPHPSNVNDRMMKAIKMLLKTTTLPLQYLHSSITDLSAVIYMDVLMMEKCRQMPDSVLSPLSYTFFSKSYSANSFVLFVRSPTAHNQTPQSFFQVSKFLDIALPLIQGETYQYRKALQ